MPKPSSHILDLAKRGAALRLRELVNEAELLLDLFPDLRDAFDPDELPVSFIVKSDARRVGARPVRRQSAPSAATKKPGSRAMRQEFAERRAGAKKRT